MAQLHLLTRSPFSQDMTHAFACIGNSDQLVLMGDGCYLLHAKLDSFELPKPILFIDEDCSARGIDADNMADFRSISIEECVSLSLAAQHVLTW